METRIIKNSNLFRLSAQLNQFDSNKIYEVEIHNERDLDQVCIALEYYRHPSNLILRFNPTGDWYKALPDFLTKLSAILIKRCQELSLASSTDTLFQRFALDFNGCTLGANKRFGMMSAKAFAQFCQTIPLNCAPDVDEGEQGFDINLQNTLLGDAEKQCIGSALQSCKPLLSVYMDDQASLDQILIQPITAATALSKMTLSFQAAIASLDRAIQLRTLECDTDLGSYELPPQYDIEELTDTLSLTASVMDSLEELESLSKFWAKGSSVVTQYHEQEDKTVTPEDTEQSLQSPAQTPSTVSLSNRTRNPSRFNTTNSHSADNEDEDIAYSLNNQNLRSSPRSTVANTHEETDETTTDTVNAEVLLEDGEKTEKRLQEDILKVRNMLQRILNQQLGKTEGEHLRKVNAHFQQNIILMKKQVELMKDQLSPISKEDAEFALSYEKSLRDTLREIFIRTTSDYNDNRIPLATATIFADACKQLASLVETRSLTIEAIDHFMSKMSLMPPSSAWNALLAGLFTALLGIVIGITLNPLLAPALAPVLSSLALSSYLSSQSALLTGVLGGALGFIAGYSVGFFSQPNTLQAYPDARSARILAKSLIELDPLPAAANRGV